MSNTNWETCCEAAQSIIMDLDIDELRLEAIRLRCKFEDLEYNLSLEFYENWEDMKDEN